MTRFRRFAAYWAPPTGSALARFGAAWLGWDAETGRAVPHLVAPGLPAPVAGITATPRRYGFHATLKPPFRLAEGASPDALDGQARAIAAGVAPFEAPRLMLARIGRFLALVPAEPSPPLDDLAARAVISLDSFRAPPEEAELARRRAAGLTPRQEEHLARWGYPYVLDEFRFHLTLTGALDPEIADRACDVLGDLTAPFCAGPVPITEFCLFGEAEDRHFRLVGRYALTG